MKSLFLFRRAAPRWLASWCAVFTLAGCASDRPSRGEHATSADSAPRAAPVPEMEGHAVFFAGQLEAEVMLGSGGFAARDAGRVARAGGGGERGRGSVGGGGGGGRRGGASGARGGGSERGGELPRPGASSGDEPAPKIRPVNAPPVQFHLRLTHHGSEPLDVEVTDFNSALGNFVVQPRKLTLPPGGTVEADPMTSRLGVSAAEIPLTLTIRAGGKTEKQVVSRAGSRVDRRLCAIHRSRLAAPFKPVFISADENNRGE